MLCLEIHWQLWILLPLNVRGLVLIHKCFAWLFWVIIYLYLLQIYIHIIYYIIHFMLWTQHHIVTKDMSHMYQKIFSYKLRGASRLTRHNPTLFPELIIVGRCLFYFEYFIIIDKICVYFTIWFVFVFIFVLYSKCKDFISEEFTF